MKLTTLFAAVMSMLIGVIAIGGALQRVLNVENTLLDWRYYALWAIGAFFLYVSIWLISEIAKGE